MASGDTPRAGPDRAIGALRLMLISAQDDGAARRHVLPALSRCKVFVPTWPNAPATVRVLMGPTGDVSMPLFTGRDALEHAAKRFNWHDGGSSFRNLDARQALRGALTQAVQFVVFDAGAEHALEVPRDEVERFLEENPEDEPSAEPKTGQHGTRDLVRATAERSSPRGTMEERIERALAAEREAEQINVRQAEPAAVKAPVATRADTRPIGAARVKAPVAAPPTKRGLAEIDDPFASLPGRSAPVKARADSGGVARRVPSGTATPLARHMPSAPFQSQLPPRPPSLPEVAAASPRSPMPASPMPRAHAPTEPMLPPAARPPVAEQVAEIAPLIEAAFVRADDHYDFGGATADTAPQPAEAFARPKTRAPEPLLPEPPARVAANIAPAAAAPEPAATPEPPRAAQPVAAAPAPAARAPHATHAEPAPIATPATPASTEAAADPARDRKITAGDLTEPFETIDDVTLSAIADDLRKYPEVEWACELSDGSGLPVIGVRIEPSYLARASEIEAHVRKAAREHGTRLSVLLLTESATTKQARAVGRMFFPWKKKR